ASIGHRQDDESGLIYMRARYYDPQAGRFISEDPSMDGINWFAYCANDPVNYSDESGRNLRGDISGLFGMLTIGSLVVALMAFSEGNRVVGLAALTVAVGSAAVAFALTDTGMGATAGLLDAVGAFIAGIADVLAAVAEAANWGMKNALAAVAVAASVIYTVTLLAYVVSAGLEPFDGGYNKEWD
ncbi:MAG: RHS repeat-associated core domain-containing protein, partial [Verrucomicrobiaceae bacterium]